MLDVTPVELIWDYLLEREGCQSGEWRLEIQGTDGVMRRRHFHLIGVDRGKQGPIRIAAERGL